MPVLSEHHIASISLSRLFGRYTYNIPSDQSSLTDLNILYGENGLGKTTLLSLVFHLLSPSRNRGHKSTISVVPFHELKVKLRDGTEISAIKDPQLLVGPCTFKVKNDKITVEWRFVPGERTLHAFDEIDENIDIDSLPEEVKDQVARALLQRKFFSVLSELEAAPFMLTSDRILLGDSAEPFEKPIDNRPSRTKLSEIVSEYRISAVEHALKGASLWLQKKFLERSYQVGDSASNVYRDVIKRIATTTYRTRSGLSKAETVKRRDELVKSIDDLNEKATRLATFGFPRSSIHESIKVHTAAATGNKLQLIENVLVPHLDELDARLTSLEPAHRIANAFVGNLNHYFQDKRATYSLRRGIEIHSKDDTQKKNPIAAAQLSSGEQQLLIIFCQVLMTKDKTNIFIIDEPEISLNILWQRMLINSLMEIAEDSQTQFVFASHSMEILAKHSDRVVTLDAL